MKNLIFYIFLIGLPVASHAQPIKFDLNYRKNELKHYEVDDIQVAYLDIGEGEPVLFLHGALSDYRIWMHQAEALKDTYRVIVPSSRISFPNSPGQDVDLALGMQGTWDGVQDAYELLDYLNISSVHIVAHSSGGATAIDFAIKNPELVKSLLLVEPANVDSEIVSSQSNAQSAAVPPEILDAINKLNSGQREEGVRIFINFASGSGYFDNLTPGARQLLMDNISTVLAGNPIPVIDCNDALALEIPVLYITGEISPRPDAFSHCFSEVEVREFEGASHGVPFEKPTLFNEVLIDFISNNN